MTCDYVNRIRLWPLRRDDHSGVLIGAGGTQRSDWPARVLPNENRSIARARRAIDCGNQLRQALINLVIQQVTLAIVQFIGLKRSLLYSVERAL